ncbi:MAG: Crp/Fnr family transcriptional regulator [Paracoccaceae bacterium]|nr:Crp/Fnr family transcriptional regulator [Paracoccaceae bacterium]
MDHKTKAILTEGWLAQFSAAFSDALLAEGTLMRIGRGTTVYNAGEDHCCLYGVVKGSLRFVITMNEQPPRFAHLVGPGTWFGENELVLGRSAILEVTSATDATLFRLNQVQFERLLESHPVGWRAIAALSTMNVGLAIGSVDDLMIRDPRQRVCAVLLRLAAQPNAPQGQPPMDTLALTQTDLSTAANLSRSKTAEILGSLAAAGAVETIYGGLKIVRAEILETELAKTM